MNVHFVKLFTLHVLICSYCSLLVLFFAKLRFRIFHYQLAASHLLNDVELNLKLSRPHVQVHCPSPYTGLLQTWKSPGIGFFPGIL